MSVVQDIGNFFVSNTMDGLTEILGQCIDFMMDGIENIYQIGEKVALGTEITAINVGTMGIEAMATVLLCCMLGKQVFTTYITETDGDPDTDPTQMLVKFSMALAAIWVLQPVFSIALDWGHKIEKMLLGSVDIKLQSNMQNVLQHIAMKSGLGTLLMAIIVVSVFLFCFKAGLRGAELLIFRILWPVFCCDIMSPSREKWNSFTFAFAVTAFSYGIQIVCFKVSIIFFIRGYTMENVVMGLAFMHMACKSPQWLSKFSYNSGLGQTVAEMGRTAMMIGMSASHHSSRSDSD